MGWESATPIVGDIIQAATIASQNKKDRAHAQDMAREARAWDLEMWNRQNQYNTPAAQMARFAEAGLNPNLIYGRGSSGNAGGLPPAKSAFTPRRALFNDLSGSIAQMFQSSNTQAQTELIKQQSITEGFKRTEMIGKMLEGTQRNIESMRRTSYSRWTEEKEKALFRGQLDAQFLNNQQTLREIRKLDYENMYSSMTIGARAFQAHYNARLAKSLYTGQQLDNELKRIEREWNKEGVTKQDNIMFRQGMKYIKEEKLQEVKKDIDIILNPSAPSILTKEFWFKPEYLERKERERQAKKYKGKW